MNTVLLKFQNFKILPLNRKCAKWVHISGCKMDRTCSVRYGLVVNAQKDACFGLSWTMCTIFKICIQKSIFNECHSFLNISALYVSLFQENRFYIHFTSFFDFFPPTVTKFFISFNRCKGSVSSKTSTFWVFFSVEQLAVHMHTMNLLKFGKRKKKKSWKQMRFYVFNPKTKHYWITTLNLRYTKFMDMQIYCD